MSDLVTALWIGSHDADMPDRRVLRSGLDTYELPRAEAESSDNWLYPIPETPKAPAKAAKEADA